MELRITERHMGLLLVLAKKERRTPEDQASVLIEESLDADASNSFPTTSEAPPKAHPTTKPRDPCRVPNCPKKTNSRGLCTQHYMACLYYIRKGVVTWAWLEAHGKVSPPSGTPAPSKESVEGQNTFRKRVGVGTVAIRWLMGPEKEESRGTV